MAKTAIEQSTKKSIPQILAGGILLTMDDDLRNLQSRNSRELRNRKQRQTAKIMPIAEKAILSAPRAKDPPSKKKRGFLGGLFKKKKKVDEIKKIPQTQKQAPKQQQTPKHISPVKKVHPTQKQTPPQQQTPEPKPVLQQKQITITQEEANSITEKREEFETQVQEIEKELSNFALKENVFNEKRKELTKQKQQLTEGLKPVLEQEAKLEAEEKVVETRENTAQSIEEKHQFESKRWAIETKRREQEQHKWSLKEKTELNDKKIKELENNFKIISDKQTELKNKKQKIVKKLEQAELFKKREGFDSAMATIEKNLIDITNQEKEITHKKEEIEQKEDAAKTTEDAKRLSQARWDLEEQRKNIEQKRWNTEKRKKDLEQEIKGIGGLPAREVKPVKAEEKPEPKIEEQPKEEKFVPRKRHSKEWKPVKHILRDEGDVSNEMSDEEKQKFLDELSKRQDLVSKKAPPSSEKTEGTEGTAKVIMPSRDLTKEEIASKIERWRKEKENKRKIGIIQETAQNYKNGTYVPKSKGPISKAVILQKLSTISPAEKSSREEFLAKVAGRSRVASAGGREVGGEIVFRPIIKRSSVFQKIFARILFLILILSFIISVIWLLYSYIFYNPPIDEHVNETLPVDVVASSSADVQPIPDEDMATSSDSDDEDISTSSDSDIVDIPDDIDAVIPEVEFPKALLETVSVNVAEFSSLVPVSDLLSNIVFVNENLNGFTQIIFQDEETQEIFDFTDFLEVFEIAPFQGFLENIETPVTLFVYSTDDKTSFGFVSKAKNNSDLISSLKAWEETMEADTELLFETLGRNSTPISSKFLTAIYKDEGFRYQTFTKQDFGICYAVTHGGYFVFTTSYDAMQKVLDNLSNNE